MNCRGDDNQTCGGRNAISIYEYALNIPKPTATKSDAYQSLGCYVDTKYDRVFDVSVEKDPDMTTEVSILSLHELQGHPRIYAVRVGCVCLMCAMFCCYCRKCQVHHLGKVDSHCLYHTFVVTSLRFVQGTLSVLLSLECSRGLVFASGALEPISSQSQLSTV